MLTPFLSGLNELDIYNDANSDKKIISLDIERHYKRIYFKFLTKMLIEFLLMRNYIQGLYFYLKDRMQLARVYVYF